MQGLQYIVWEAPSLHALTTAPSRRSLLSVSDTGSRPCGLCNSCPWSPFSPKRARPGPGPYMHISPSVCMRPPSRPIDVRCRANLAHDRQSNQVVALAFKYKSLNPFKLFHFCSEEVLSGTRMKHASLLMHTHTQHFALHPSSPHHALYSIPGITSNPSPRNAAARLCNTV